MSRFIVTEIEGWLQSRGSHRGAGRSCHVIDTAYCHRLVATYRTEDNIGGWKRTKARALEVVREQAHEHAARLNAECA